MIPAYVYYIKHVPSGKFYYGSRYKHIDKGIDPADDLWKNYFSSSKEILKLINESGIDSFEYTIIFTNIDYQTCFDFEQTLIKENINNPLCINKRYFDSLKGSSIFCTYGKTLSSKGKPKSDDTKEKMRKPKSQQHRENISKSQKLNGGNGPEKHKEETKIKIRETHKLLKRPKVTCPHCLKTGGSIAMTRWHFEHCKEKNEQSTI